MNIYTHLSGFETLLVLIYEYLVVFEPKKLSHVITSTPAMVATAVTAATAATAITAMIVAITAIAVMAVTAATTATHQLFMVICRQCTNK